MGTESRRQLLVCEFIKLGLQGSDVPTFLSQLAQDLPPPSQALLHTSGELQRVNVLNCCSCLRVRAGQEACSSFGGRQL